MVGHLMMRTHGKSLLHGLTWISCRGRTPVAVDEDAGIVNVGDRYSNGNVAC